MKVRIVSKGTADTTQVLLDGGKELPQVAAVRFVVDFNRQPIAVAVIETIMTEVDLECEADVLVTTLPDGKRYRLEEIASQPHTAPVASKASKPA